MYRGYRCQRAAIAEDSFDRRLTEGDLPASGSGGSPFLSRIFPLLFVFSSTTTLYSQGTCSSVSVTLTPDYQYAIGTSNGGASFAWTENGQTIAQGPIT